MSAKVRPAVRAAAVVLLLGALGSTAGCGGDASAPRPARLDITAPTDGAVVREDVVEVRGRVRPAGARVLVGGRAATVEGGEFAASVPLRVGSNLIDVGASARGSASAWAAVRISRETLVRVPDLVDETRQDAVDRLKDLGLEAEVHEESGLLEELLPAEVVVCEIRPRPGTQVSSGARVRLLVSKTC